jgi:hypothetical protein
MVQKMSKKQVGVYVLDRRIGKGSYGQVWQGHIEGKEHVEVAIKVISRSTISETAQLRQEVQALKKIEHKNVVRFIDLKKSSGHFYLILEYCRGGDLARFIASRGRVAEGTAQRFLRDISAGLITIHKQGFLHRDLKPSNLLLSEDSEIATVKIADFGFARALQPFDMAATICGSPLYMAPEILRHERYDGRADIWSVAAIIFELLFGRPPFTGTNPLQLLVNIERAVGGRVSIPDEPEISSYCRDLLLSVLVKNPNDRISCFRFFTHPFNGESLATEAADYPEVFEQVDIPSVEPLPSDDEDEEAVATLASPRTTTTAVIAEQHRDQVAAMAATLVPVEETKCLEFLDVPPLGGTFSGTRCAIARALRVASDRATDANKTACLMKALELLDKAIEESTGPGISVLKTEWSMTWSKLKDQSTRTPGGELGQSLLPEIEQLIRDAAADTQLSEAADVAINRLRVADLLVDFLVAEGDAGEAVDVDVWQDHDRPALVEYADKIKAVIRDLHHQLILAHNQVWCVLC